MAVKITLVISDFGLHQNLHDYPNLLFLIKHHHALRDSLDLNATLCQLFGHKITVESQLPIAALSGLGENLPVQQGWWLRADPVELRVDGTAIYMLGNAHLELKDTEQNPWQQKLMEYFAAEDIKLFTPKLNAWYLQLTEDPGIQTYAIENCLGKHIHPFLPEGPNKKKWLRMLTEIQMLFYTDKLMPTQNTVNSVWFWGEGKLPSQGAECHWTKIWNDTALGNGLARLNNISCATPNTFRECLSDMSKGKYFLILNAANHTDLEQDWFMPIVAALKQKQISSVDFYLGDGKHYQTTPRSILGWRYFL